jgi:hypothetical protein
LESFAVTVSELVSTPAVTWEGAVSANCTLYESLGAVPLNAPAIPPLVAEQLTVPW